MPQTKNRTSSIWQRTPPLRFPFLEKDLETTVCIIGAGISGLTTALALQEAGIKTVVIEAGEIGSGETVRTSAHLSNAFDNYYQKIEYPHVIAESHTEAITFIERTARNCNIDCEFERVPGYLFLGGSSSEDFLKSEMEAAHRAGLTDVSWCNQMPGLKLGPALMFLNQAQFNPAKYINGLAREVIKRGGDIYSHTRAEQIDEGELFRVHTGQKRKISCKYIVIATNAPFLGRVALHTKQVPYRTYVIGAKVKKGSLTRALYWDTSEPYHYARLVDDPNDPEMETLIIGGEDHKTGHESQTSTPFYSLKAWAKLIFGDLISIDFCWSGQILEPVDGRAFIGRYPGHENVFVISGDSGHGLTHGTIGGILITDLIQKRANPWQEAYDPKRFPLHEVKEFVKQNLDVAAQYTDWVRGGDVESEEEIPLDSGAIIRQGLTKTAIYKDKSGVLHQFSATCPHFGGVVHWNDSEKTWDCPCHGSRFSCLGKVINGPANTDLRPQTGPYTQIAEDAISNPDGLHP